MAEIELWEGRRAFGADPAGYDRARPGYPARVYELLRDRCGLRSGTRTFEIGPGTGQATRRLLQMRAAPLVVVEPDERLAAFLMKEVVPSMGGHGVEVKVAAFEDVDLPDASFDLGVAATSFHWLQYESALRKIARILRPGGWWAMWWNVFGDPSRPDAFHEATRGILDKLGRSPSAGTAGRPPFALDIEARIADLANTGEFDEIASETIRWTETFDSARIRAVFATFSEITRLSPELRQQILDDLTKVADEQFGGTVAKPLVTQIYTSRRR